MDRTTSIDRRYLRSAIEIRLQRRLSDQEFERVLQLGNGVYWDYRQGKIGPYDPASLPPNLRPV